MQTQSYNIFRKRLHLRAKVKAFPLRVMFELTYRCNFKCGHCYVPPSYRNKEELKTKEVFFIIDQLKEIGCFYLGFTGGEVFIRKDIMDILWYAKRKGFTVIIYSNGSLINEDTAKELQLLRPNKVDITIPAIAKNTFEQITGIPGSYKRVFRAIDLLHKRGIKLGFKSCLLRENESEIKKIEEFSTFLGASYRLGYALFPRLDGSKKPYRFREEVVSRKSKVEDDSPECELQSDARQARSANFFKCGVGVSQAAITPQGKLKMCVMIDYPKYKILDSRVASYKLQVVSHKSQARSQELEEGQGLGLGRAWEKLKKLSASIQPDENYHCDRCKFHLYCGWCPARGWVEKGNFSACDSESRKWAETNYAKSNQQ